MGQLCVDVTTSLVEGRFPARPCSNIIDILTNSLVLGSLEMVPATFGFLLIKLSEAVLELDQERTAKKWSDGDICKGELIAEDVLSFLNRRELILNRVKSLEESVVRAGSVSPLAQVRLDLVESIQEESDLGFPQGILREQVRLRSEVGKELDQNERFCDLR